MPSSCTDPVGRRVRLRVCAGTLRLKLAHADMDQGRTAAGRAGRQYPASAQARAPECLGSATKQPQEPTTTSTRRNGTSTCQHGLRLGFRLRLGPHMGSPCTMGLVSRGNAGPGETRIGHPARAWLVASCAQEKVRIMNQNLKTCCRSSYDVQFALSRFGLLSNYLLT